jgi:hypothetical protein
MCWHDVKQVIHLVLDAPNPHVLHDTQHIGGCMWPNSCYMLRLLTQ